MSDKHKKLLRIALGIVLLGSLAFALKYYKDTSFEGNEGIRFLEGEYASLDALLRAEPFRGKVVYVDLWFSTCPFCLKEIRELPPVKEYLKERNVEFLYLSHRTRHPNTEQLWKNAIRELDLTGWHYMMDRDFEAKVWQELRAADSTVRGGFPHYLLLDNTSGYRNYNAPKPSRFEDLKKVFENLPPSSPDE
jgi:thiol-disulfide isomerase/thioredoxin